MQKMSSKINMKGKSVFTTLNTTTLRSHSILLLLAPLVLLIPLVPFASAHPFIVDSTPNTAQNGPAGTTEVIVFFSEAVDIEYSEIKVINDKGDRIDNKDLRYYQQDDLSLIVATPPLEDGVYTVSTKVLSKVDGHLVPSVFLFGIGDVTIDPALLGQEKTTELVFLPEAGSDLPGIIGQTIVVGAAVSALAVWNTQNKQAISRNELTKIEQAHRKKFLRLSSAGLLLVLASDVLVIILQMLRLETGLAETVQTQFGMIWLVRFIITLLLFGIWFAANRAKEMKRSMQAVMLAAALALMMTSSLAGHGAATEALGAVVLDYIHNIVAGVWIGGIIYIIFGLLPALSNSSESYREKLSMAVIPRFSMVFIISVGIVIVTGPTLLWTLESDVGLITESLYGKLIMLKVAIASAMIGMGAFIQYKIQRKAEADIKSSTSKKIMIHGRLKKTLKIDMALGISLLVVVAILTNGTLPAGEVRNVEAQEIFTGFTTTKFSENARFDIEITPFGTGENLITVSALNSNGTGMEDLNRIKVKASNPSRSIPPLELDMNDITRGGTTDYKTYSGKLTLAFSGQWLLEVEAQRTQNANEAVHLDVFAKPQLESLDITVAEYVLPNGTSPLHVAYDHAGSMWFSDALSPRLWKINVNSGEITEHVFDGEASSFLTYNRYDGNIWFTDSRGGQIGYVDTQNGEIKTIKTPDFKSDAPTATLTSDRAMPFFIEAGYDGDIWLTIINKGLVVRYDINSGEFEKIPIQGRNTLPFALEAGPDEKTIWYTAIGMGTVGYINTDDNSVTETIGEDRALASPEALLIEEQTVGSLWITEHTGTAVVKYDPILDTLEKFTVSNSESSPFGMAFDRYGNIWFAQHTVDSIGVLDPRNGKIREIDIPAATLSVQFVESDGDGNIWFAEQRANKIGMISISERSSTYDAADQQKKSFTLSYLSDIRYADLVSPLMALGVLATSLFYIRAVHDKRRLDSLLLGLTSKESS